MHFFPGKLLIRTRTINWRTSSACNSNTITVAIMCINASNHRQNFTSASGNRSQEMFSVWYWFIAVHFCYNQFAQLPSTLLIRSHRNSSRSTVDKSIPKVIYDIHRSPGKMFKDHEKASSKVVVIHRRKWDQSWVHIPVALGSSQRGTENSSEENVWAWGYHNSRWDKQRVPFWSKKLRLRK